MLRTSPLLTPILAAALLVPASAAAQPDSVALAAGERYAASAPWRALFGASYRELWTTPARFEVLDLDAFAGGLTPVQARSGRQTRSLRLRGADGLEYDFRSVDKDLTPDTPGQGGGTLRQRLRQDQTHAQHPAAVVVASALLEAAGVPHAAPRLLVMPDDPRLGPHRAGFAGMLGSLEVRLDEEALPSLGLPQARRLVDTEALIPLLDGSARHRVDARAYLRARLMDLLLGDWDRHEGQWRWARIDEAGGHRWVVIPKDRDYAFVDYDGAIPALVRSFATPGVVRFGPEYPRLRPLVHSGRPLDARILAGLPRAAWDSVARDLRGRLGDRAIARAVRRMPAEYHARSGARLEAALRARRDALPAAARELYRRLALEPEIVGTEEAERIEVRRLPRGAVEIAMWGGGRPLLLRRFTPAETRRIVLRPGAERDTLVLRGSGGCIWVTVEAPPGEDLLHGASAFRGRDRWHLRPVARQPAHDPTEGN